MPTRSCPYDRLWPQRWDAWYEHYRRKGASDAKASRLARSKRYKNNWPPA